MNDKERFERFTEQTRKVLRLAQEEAQRFNHNAIGTEHVLLGLIGEGDGVASKVLSNLGVTLNKLGPWSDLLVDVAIASCWALSV